MTNASAVEVVANWEPEVISSSEVVARVIQSFGLDAEALDFSSEEALAAMVRSVVGILGPSIRRTLADNVILSLRGLVAEDESLRERINQQIEALVGYGDLVETDLPESKAVAVCLAPTRFVYLGSGVAFLLGGEGPGLPPLTEELLFRIRYAGHTRRILQEETEELREVLRESGLIEVPSRQWLRKPDSTSPEILVERVDQHLALFPVTHPPDGLMVLDSTRPVRFYPGRWSAPTGLTGSYVARRAQEFGASRWCIAGLSEGELTHLVDLPQGPGRGCDEAWSIQLAKDYLNGTPQEFRTRSAGRENVVVELFSPIPSWAQRRLDSVGSPVPAIGSLMAYRLGIPEFTNERQVLEGELWLSERTNSHGSNQQSDVPGE